MFSKGHKPIYLFRTDAGQEFCGKQVQALLKDNKITHLLPGIGEIKAGHVERLIKTLRTRLSKIMLHNQNHT